MIRVGVVAELDEANARVKMNVGGLTTDWLPWGTARAGATGTWSAPRPGEQMVVFAPYGDTGQAIVMGSIPQDDHPAPATSKDQERTVYPDGSTVDYNSATNTLTVTVAASGNVVVNCKHATLNATEDVTVNTKLATVNASTKIELVTPLVHCTQALTVDGLLTGLGGMAISGGSGATVNGSFAAQNGAFTHNSKNVGSTHTHTGVSPGGSQTGAPP